MKTFFKSLSGILILIVIALVIVLFIGWSRIPDLVANSLSKKMKVSVEIEDILLSMQAIEIDKLEIGNPKGSILQKALSADTINIRAPITRYLDHHIVIDEIVIDTVFVGLEFDSQGSKHGNWTTIMKNFQDSSSGKEKTRSVLIKKLILTNLSLDLVYRSQGSKIKHLPSIDRLEFTNVTSEGGIPADQIANVILKETLRSIFQRENLQNMLENIILGSPQGALQNIIEPFKGFLNP